MLALRLTQEILSEPTESDEDSAQGSRFHAELMADQGGVWTRCPGSYRETPEQIAAGRDVSAKTVSNQIRSGSRGFRLGDWAGDRKSGGPPSADTYSPVPGCDGVNKRSGRREIRSGAWPAPEMANRDDTEFRSRSDSAVAWSPALRHERPGCVSSRNGVMLPEVVTQ